MVSSASHRQPLPFAGSYTSNFDGIDKSDKPDVTRLCLSHLGVVHCRRSKDDEIRGRNTELTTDQRGTARDAPLMCTGLTRRLKILSLYQSIIQGKRLQIVIKR